MHNRYPRPQMRRESFQSLDGEWLINGVPGQVPECRSEEDLLYFRTFTFHKEKSRAILHIGAADQLAEINLNGRFIGRHEGGYLPFSFDISDSVQEGINELSIHVTDRLDRTYPYGKQTKKPGGMWYTPVSGIWKSVWLEQVPDVYITDIRITPDLGGADIELTTSLGDRETRRIDVPDPVLWTPDSPQLYSETLTLGEDSIETYFALRTVDIREIGGIQRICLNGSPIFINAVLDQGYWQHTLFIPDTEDGYEQDILRMKELGFNTLRKHIKIEDEEFYYQCDRLGMLVIQDMVQTGGYSFLRDTALPTVGFRRSDRTGRMTSARSFFISHSRETIKQLYSHPCIIIWTIFNEGWGQFNSDELYRQFKQLDPTRLIDSTSGWFAQHESDLDSLHIYFKLKELHPAIRPLLVSECGGYSLTPEGAKLKWGYGKCADIAELTDRILELYEKMIIPGIPSGVCGAVYTQLSDVEGELNGLYTFGRSCKIDKQRIIECMKGIKI